MRARCLCARVPDVCVALPRVVAVCHRGVCGPHPVTCERACCRGVVASSSLVFGRHSHRTIARVVRQVD